MTPPKFKKPVYISITGLRLKRWWHVLKFYFLAAPAVQQAREAPGNLFTDVTTRSGVHHTLTVWENEDAMRAYIYSGHHKKAIEAFSSIATGKTFGYTARKVPDWNEVQRLFDEKGREYGPSDNKDDSDGRV